MTRSLAAIPKANRLDDGFVKHPTNPGQKILPPMQKDRKPLPDPPSLFEIMSDRMHIIIVHRHNATEIFENLHPLKGLTVVYAVNSTSRARAFAAAAAYWAFRSAPSRHNVDCSWSREFAKLACMSHRGHLGGRPRQER